MKFYITLILILSLSGCKSIFDVTIPEVSDRMCYKEDFTAIQKPLEMCIKSGRGADYCFSSLVAIQCKTFKQLSF